MNTKKQDLQKSILLQRLAIFKIKNLLFFVAYLICNPSLFKPLLRGVYLPTLIQYKWLKKFKLGTFIDVGAYTGEDSKVVNHLFPNAKIYAFEPDVSNYEIIKRSIRIKNFELFDIALSNKKGITTFYSHPLSALSSLLRISKIKVLDEPYVYQKTKNYSVKTNTLDNVLGKKKLKGKVLLKIDTQGAENLILDGAIKILKKVDLIHIETCMAEIYENQSDFSKIYSMLTKNGFTFVGEAKESEFYPLFELKKCFNSVFIKNNLLKENK